jgi:hypothetical protein
MSLEEKVNLVKAVFEKLDKEIAAFQSWSGLHCKFGCGKCCTKPDIEATILEFLPFIYFTKINLQRSGSRSWKIPILRFV